MITTCTECQARYQLDAEKIPPRVIKVRCPSCGGVFSLDGSQARHEAVQPQEEPLNVQRGIEPESSPPAFDRQAAPVQAPDPAPSQPSPAATVEPSVSQAPSPEPVVSQESPVDPSITQGFPSEAAPVEPAAPATAEPEFTAPESAATDSATTEPAAGVAVMDRPVAAGSRRRKSKEEMLARALVSDILVYNRDLYDRAKAEGNLLEALGTEIKKSWELYKEKVTPEVANSTNHFREALNEILADGDDLF